MACFKECKPCGTIWTKRDEFLSDPNVGFVGYQVNFDESSLGGFLFNHHSCRATLVLPALKFFELHEGPIFELRRRDANDFPSYCLFQNQIGRCLDQCECAFVRNITNIIKEWPKLIREC